MNEDKYINARTLKQDLAISGLSYETRQMVQRIIDAQKCVDILERDEGMEPLFTERTSVIHYDYADGHGGTGVHRFKDWTCPKCGWFVGELYCGFGKWHIQGERSYCARCGQKIDWTKPSEEEKRRYEGRKAEEREAWRKRTGSALDNMNEFRRKKYGVMNDKS